MKKANGKAPAPAPVRPVGGLVDMFTTAIEPAIESPPQNIMWSGIALTSSLMGRLCWTNVRSESLADRLFGNLFILLIGEPGAGKTTPIVEARKLAMTAEVRMGPDDITGERLIHYCRTARWDDDDGDMGKNNKWNKKSRRERMDDDADGQPRGTIAIFLNEFEQLFHEGNAKALKRTMTDFYDCRQETYTRETYQRGTQNIDEMCMSLIGAATPAHMGRLFTRDEWQEGLPSRFIYVWGDPPEMKTRFARDSKLMKDLERESRLVREFVFNHNQIPWQPRAAKARAEWRVAHGRGGLPHPLLAGYNTRRYVSACKLALVLAASRRSPSIGVEDWENAIGSLLATEEGIPKALAQAGGNEYRAIIVWAAAWVRDERKVEEWVLRRKLGQQLPPQHIEPVLNEMINSRMVAIKGGASPNRHFSPGEVDQ